MMLGFSPAWPLAKALAERIRAAGKANETPWSVSLQETAAIVDPQAGARLDARRLGEGTHLVHDLDDAIVAEVDNRAMAVDDRSPVARPV